MWVDRHAGDWSLRHSRRKADDTAQGWTTAMPSTDLSADYDHEPQRLHYNHPGLPTGAQPEPARGPQHKPPDGLQRSITLRPSKSSKSHEIDAPRIILRAQASSWEQHRGHKGAPSEPPAQSSKVSTGYTTYYPPPFPSSFHASLGALLQECGHASTRDAVRLWQQCPG